jgi:hypothetical protein|mmetsp:Transcript_46129/g.77612  ORF Transcript_46129/g.77612 Transcript_46129/m.77612 type:complete len:114 (-) Transcript_46129:161-502(-)
MDSNWATKVTQINGLGTGTINVMCLAWGSPPLDSCCTYKATEPHEALVICHLDFSMTCRELPRVHMIAVPNEHTWLQGKDATVCPQMRQKTLPTPPQQGERVDIVVPENQNLA